MLKPATKEAFQLLMEGQVAFSRIECAGLKIDRPYLEKAISSTETRILELENRLQTSKEHQIWAKHFGNKMNLRSRQQLGKVLFGLCGHKRNPFMGLSNDVAAFEHLKSPFMSAYHEVERLKKALKTNLHGILRELDDRNYIHPFFNLLAESYRSTSQSPNFQNQPIRNKEIAKIVRSSVICPPGYEIHEYDYGTQEVRMAYFYCLDPKLLYDIIHGDMHRDRAKELFLLTDEEMGPNDGNGRQTRYVGKNGFVFAEFYGSYYIQRAPALWDYISILDLKTTAGLSLHQHLASKGIKTLGKCDPELDPEPGTFEHHVREVERKMWKEVYVIYDAWKTKWWDDYQRNGGINTLTGFKMEGVFKKNQILCDPIQGSAFHCLLWSIIEIQKELIRRKMKSRIICQVHDSMNWYVWKPERDDVIKLVLDVAVGRVAKHWPWITTPLSVDLEVSETNWFEKKPYNIDAFSAN
jgi:DNA polymerase I